MGCNWKRRVYGKNRKGLSKIVIREQWRALRKSVLVRDKYTCYRCFKQNKSGQGLSVHHIIPRDVGGQDEADNLITLCHPCHDFVELENFRSLSEIADSRNKEIKSKEQLIYKKEESFERPAWHGFVYGGDKNPNV